MIDKSKIVQSVTTVPTRNKDSILEEMGGPFLFGYRLVDSDGQVFNDPTFLDGIFETTSNSWNETDRSYVQDTTRYFTNDCNSTFEEDIRSNFFGERLAFDITQLDRLAAPTFICPKSLKRDFVNGALGDANYTSTVLKIIACNPDYSTCADYDDIVSKVTTLQVQFIYLETNFEAEDIDQPLSSYFMKMNPVGLSYNWFT